MAYFACTRPRANLVSMQRATLYLRLSAVHDDSTSIVRQEKDLRTLADREGWEVVAVLVDEGISGRKARAKAAEAVRMLRDGETDVLAVWKLDRFTRQGWDGLGELSRALAARPEARFVALQDGLRSDQAAFRLIAGVLSEVARSEADNTAARQRSAIDFRRRSGKYAGGASIPFGYRSVPAPDGVGRVLVPSRFESAVIREVAARLLSGTEPMSAICKDLEARGVATSRSPARRAIMDGKDPAGLDRGRWRAAQLHTYWTSDTLLGRQRHRGDFIRDAHGMPAEVFPPVLDAATLHALRARLRNPPTNNTPEKPHNRRAARLLSGVAFCARCDGKMYVTSNGGKPTYMCKNTWSGHCPGTRIRADRLEDYVTEQFLAVVGSAPETTTDPPDSHEAELAEVEAALQQATEALLRDDSDTAAIVARLGQLKARRSALRTAQPARVELRPTGRTLAEAWAETDSPAWRRAVLLLALDHVSIHPAPAKHMTPMAERCEFHWVS